MKQKINNLSKVGVLILVVGGLLYASSSRDLLVASSHREAPMIAADRQADNTDVYAFRSPDNPNTVTIIANYSPDEAPQGGPNYYQFGEDIRYEIHVKNDPDTQGDDIIYRFEFSITNEDPTTFFYIRLGQQNLKETYTCQRSVDGGNTFQTIISDGFVPPNNVGPRSITRPVGLNTTYADLRNNGIMTASTGETIFCGPSDDPFFVDLGAIFDLANVVVPDLPAPRPPKDGLSCKNTRSLVIKAPISTLQKDGKDVSQAINILDSDFIIGVYATASRQSMRVLSPIGDKPTTSGNWIQISRLGMPLNNEVINPIGVKDFFNSQDPYNETEFEKYLTNPELALYMDNTQFGTAVPNLKDLRIQSNSLQMYDFRNFHNGAAGLLGDPATIGTALDPALYGEYLLRPGQPRSLDILPIFHTGVPNLPPYQLATGKPAGNPLAPGKPFVNNFLPTFGDMLRLNMAVPVTPRNDPNFSTLGLIQAVVLGLTDPAYNTTTALQFIPNMDGFPNGRRLEDDVTRIELQAVSGVVLAALGFFYDDYTVGDPSGGITPNLLQVLGFTTGVEKNDVPLEKQFPFMAFPHNGFLSPCTMEGELSDMLLFPNQGDNMKLAAPELFMSTYPNPASTQTTFKYRVQDNSTVTLRISNSEGKVIDTPINAKTVSSGTYELNYNLTNLPSGIYFAALYNKDQMVQYVRFVVSK